MSFKIALAGNPNSGKTTLFNELTGSTQYVGNWPGVTVEKKEGNLKSNKSVIVQDLPGIYSLSPYTLEEVVSRNYLIKEKPDVIINIVDATNIERNLYLTTQLQELNIPMVVALNMMDLIEKNGDVLNVTKLKAQLGCEIIEISALKGRGTEELIKYAIKLAENKAEAKASPIFSSTIEQTLGAIETIVEKINPSYNSRWYAIKLFERDEKVLEELNLSKDQLNEIEETITPIESAMDDVSESIITGERYAYITKITTAAVQKKNKSKMTTSDKIDQVVTNRFLALPIFALVMFLVYFISISTVGTAMTDWVNEDLFEEMIPEAVTGLLESIGTAQWLLSLIVDGIIAGVGAVLGFLPQMLVLFLCLAFLEDCGYMARIAFIMDRIFRKFGLSGKSFIPILIGTGCGVPGIMASRTIENESDRKMTIITTTFIPCGAKLPIIALIAGSMFAGAWWVAPSAYFIGIGAIIISGIMLKKTKTFAGEPAPFVMELPTYHMPGLKGILVHTWERGKSFVKKAGSIILVASVLVWFLSSFSWSLEMVDADASMLASIGNIIAHLFTPLGWGQWRAAVATITGLIAKENVVGTFGILYGMEEVAEDGVEIWANMQASFTALSAYSFLVFNLLCAPCFAAIGAVKREMGSVKWTLIAVAYQTLFAYGASLIVYQFGLLFTGGGFGLGTIAALLVLIGTLYLLFKKTYVSEKPSNLRAVNVGR